MTNSSKISDAKALLIDELSYLVDSYPDPLKNWAQYALGLDQPLKHSGGFGRSIMLLLFVDLDASLIKAACGIELIHQASLIADDLIDHSLELRGRLAFHKQFGIEAAVLTSHYLLRSGETQIMNSPFKPKQLSKVYAKINNCISKMAEAESGQLNRPLSNFNQYRAYTYRKTGELYSLVGLLVDMLMLPNTNDGISYEETFSKIGFLRQASDDLTDTLNNSPADYDTPEAYEADTGRAINTILKIKREKVLAIKEVENAHSVVEKMIFSKLKEHPNRIEISKLTANIIGTAHETVNVA